MEVLGRIQSHQVWCSDTMKKKQSITEWYLEIWKYENLLYIQSVNLREEDTYIQNIGYPILGIYVQTDQLQSIKNNLLYTIKSHPEIMGFLILFP